MKKDKITLTRNQLNGRIKRACIKYRKETEDKGYNPYSRKWESGGYTWTDESLYKDYIENKLEDKI